MRVIAYCKRFLQLTKRCKANTEMTSYLSVAEILEALNVCIRQNQQQYFQSEIVALNNKTPVVKKNSLYKLNIFLDKNDIIGIGYPSTSR